VRGWLHLAGSARLGDINRHARACVMLGGADSKKSCPNVLPTVWQGQGNSPRGNKRPLCMISGW
jgi:hypothetical protein